MIEAGPAEKILENPETSYTKALMAAAFDLKADRTGVVNT